MSIDSVTIDTEDWQGAGFCTIGDVGGGVLGAEIASTGTGGAGYGYNDMVFPADNAKEICGRIVAWPSAGLLVAYEDTSFTYTPAADGVYTFQYQLYVDYAAVGAPQTVTLTSGSSTLSAVMSWVEMSDSTTVLVGNITSLNASLTQTLAATTLQSRGKTLVTTASQDRTYVTAPQTRRLSI